MIVGGVLIAACVMRHWNFDEMLVSESDILDGIALSLARIHLRPFWVQQPRWGGQFAPGTGRVTRVA